MSSSPHSSPSSRRTTTSSAHTDRALAEHAAIRRLTEGGRGSAMTRTSTRAPHASTPFPASPVAVSQADGEA